MDQNSLLPNATEITNDASILALSWDLSTHPSLYRELALNPFSLKARETRLGKYPNSSLKDCIKAIVIAEPEGRYDRDFNQLPFEQQEIERLKQIKITAEITKRLTKFYGKHAKELRKLNEDLIYDILFKNAFETANIHEIEGKFSQYQRKCIKLLIFNFTEDSQRERERFFGDELRNKKNILAAVLTIVVLISSSLLSFNIIQGVSHKSVPVARAVGKVRLSSPERLVIPSINVNAKVQYVGVNSKGAMDVPDNSIDVGWYDLGPRPGEKGNAVIAGHFDDQDGKAGVFTDLDKLKEGDMLYTVDYSNKYTSFIVRKSRLYDSGYVNEVFISLTDGAHLNLVTCDGVWDGSKKSYSKRLVVFSDMLR